MNDASSDFLVIGSGLSGISAALKLSRLGSVALVTKAELSASNTEKAQGGIAAVTTEPDSFASHINDTLQAGDGLCDPEIVRLAVEQAPERTAELIHMGVQFSCRNSKPDLGLEGGHSNRRILHSDDATGLEIQKTLVRACRKNQNIAVYENHTAIDLILKQHARNVPPWHNACYGAYILNTATGKICNFTARFTILASGGAGKVYRYTSNPDIATGDGMAMAFRAGAPLKNMEFVQFHPTCLYHPQAKSFLVTEALRGEGAVLKTPDGRPFMRHYSPMKDLAPRYIVARAIDNELKKRGGEFVLLDITHKKPGFIKDRFPNIYKNCLKYGIDITRQPIPVVPAAHFFCGGVETDKWGKTALRGLYAIGETACTGFHGANRLASNSLLEACVFAHQVALDIEKNLADFPLKKPGCAARWDSGKATPSDEAVIIAQNWEEIRTLMWNYAGLVRSDKRLERARRRMDLMQEEIRQYYWNFLVTRDLLELRNIACLADVIIRCATRRRESRGLHYNMDCPKTRPEWQKPSIIDRYSF